jgi:hypothetical protein
MARAAIAVFATNMGIQVVGDSCVVVKQLGPWTCIMCVVFFFAALKLFHSPLLGNLRTKHLILLDNDGCSRQQTKQGFEVCVCG